MSGESAATCVPASEEREVRSIDPVDPVDPNIEPPDELSDAVSAGSLKPDEITLVLVLVGLASLKIR